MQNQKYSIAIKIIQFLFVLSIVGLPIVKAADFNTTISAEDKEKFNEILTPVNKIYNFVKYTASIIAAIALLFAGISYMFSGNDIRKRDTAKGMATYVIFGLVIIWAAPFVVNFLIT